MKYTINEQFNCVVIELKGDVVGGPHAVEFREDLHELIDQGKTNIIINLGKVKFMNSSGLGILISALTTVKKADGRLVISEANKKIDSLLMTTQLNKVFENYSTLEEAKDSFQQKTTD